MDSRDLVVIGMCAILIVAGAVIMRLSKRDRAMGVITLLIGAGALVAYFAGEDQPVPDDVTTPTVFAADPFASATPPIGD